MKSKLGLLGVVLLLNFGLTSCKSDETTTPPPADIPAPEVTPTPAEVTGFEVQNLDGTFQRIENLREILWSSHLTLQISDQALAESRTVVTTQCRTHNFRSLNQYSTSYAGTNSVPVLSTIPYEAFTPEIREGDHLMCDLLLEVFVDDTLRAQINLEEVKILKDELPTELLSQELQLIDDRPQFLQKEQVRALTWNNLTGVSDFYLLCNEQSANIRVEGNQLPLRHLFASLELEDGIQTCRFISRNLETSAYQFSPKFWLQSEVPQVETWLEPRLQASLRTRLDLQEIASIFIHNTSSVPAWILFREYDGEIKIRPFVQQIRGRTHEVYALSEMRSRGRWVIQEPMATRQRQSGRDDRVMLNPGETVELVLEVNRQLVCTEFQPNPMVQTNCGTNFHFVGFTYALLNTLRIYKNNFSRVYSPAWERLDLGLSGIRTANPRLRYYSPRVDVPNTCRTEQTLRRLPRDFEVFNPNQRPAQLASVCSWN